MEIIPYSYLDHNAILERIAGLLQAQNLCYSSNDLKKLGVECHEEIASAVGGAMRACLSSGVSLEENFKLIYASGEEGIVPTWELSEKAFRLAILNADSGIPSIARLQLRLIEYFDHVEKSSDR